MARRPAEPVADDPTEEVLANPATRCTIARALEQMPPETAEKFRKLFEMPASKAPASRIVAALKKRGYDVGQLSGQRHRRGVCSCGR